MSGEGEPPRPSNNSQGKLKDSPNNFLIAGVGLQRIAHHSVLFFFASSTVSCLARRFGGTTSEGLDGFADVYSFHMFIVAISYSHIFPTFFPHDFRGRWQFPVFGSCGSQHLSQDWRGGVRRTAVDALARLFTGPSGGPTRGYRLALN